MEKLVSDYTNNGTSTSKKCVRLPNMYPLLDPMILQKIG